MVKHAIKAFALVEIMLAIFVFSLFSVGIVLLSLDVLQRDSKVQVDSEGLLYAQEGLEATRNLRDQNFLLLETGDHGLNFDGSIWSFAIFPEVIDGYYSRTITVSDVYRDGEGNIAEAGVLDPMTKKILSKVEWNFKGIFPQSVSLSTFLSNWTDDEWMQTTCSEFSGGDFDDTENVNSVSPPPDNCALELLLVEGQSPFFASVDVGDHGKDVVVDGDYAYLITGKAQEGLVIADISDPSNLEVLSELDIGGKGRYVTKNGNHLYIGVETSSKGLAVVNVTDPQNPSLIAQKNLGGYGNQPVVSGSTLYMGVEKSSNSFVSYNISDPASPSLLGQINVGAATNAVHILDHYAVIGIESSGSGLRIIDILTPGSMSQVSSFNAGAEVNAIEINSSIAYLGLASTSNSLKVVNLSDLLSPSLVTSVDVNGEIQDLKAEGNYLYAPTGETNYSLPALNITNPLAPYIVFYADITGKGTGVDTTEDNVFVSIDINNRGLVLIETTNVQLASTGTFTSEIFDTGSNDARFDFLQWEAISPPTGSVSFQLRTADTVAHITSAVWVGPDGTSGSSYSTSPSEIILSPSRTGSRYVQVRMTMTSDGVSSPVVESISIHYTP